ncbi:MAG: nuclear transport factor 2 family protein [Sphingomonadales bacterium]|nr:nuclear transport factor 2 family protein [Sphingomonadales bacterium]
MADTEAMRRVALDFIRAMSTNDTALADACLAPEAIAVARGFGKFAGTRRRDVMVGTIDAFARILPTGLRLTPRTVTAEGDRVVVECEGDATTCDGKAYANQYVFIFTFAGGLIARVDEYFCHVLANEVLWPLVEAEGERLAAG